MINNHQQQNSIPLLESDHQRRSSVDNGEVHISESTYYTQMIQLDDQNQHQQDELKSSDLMSLSSTLPDINQNQNQKLTRKQLIFKYLNLIKRFTFGNRRLKSYIMTCAKFFSITFTQANNLFELDKTNTDVALIKSIEIISYTFMALLLLSFTERYIRECYCAAKQINLNVIINYIEAGIFFLYFAFSSVTAIIHLVFIGRAANDPIKPYDSTKIGLGIFAILINYYIIMEKAWIYFKASKASVSLYLAKGTPIPNPNSKHFKKK
ncbi:predicted protein [Naegleria gruberi]|uniref:Predicted protein n=1 Tax=Naegleria gruberi TaxID=5762 RepID=D2VBR6_NAEGR|nr:uncharacterized protein NAEGRDRAFT_66308 [Naegleria gruberi]EFC45844.1 predicted protein [Naegleria gruberi]|eukprot:XP_002678588.1 predicted protein [Naegleria gruberi strain NEG-M]